MGGLIRSWPMQTHYSVPEFNKTAFNCPHCGAFAEQKWSELRCDIFAHQNDWELGRTLELLKNKGYSELDAAHMRYEQAGGIFAAICAHCKKYSYWLERKMLWPAASTIEMPNPDMPEECQKLYMEARIIAGQSPRAAAALLRLCVEKFILALGGTEKKLADGIQALIDNGKISQAEQEYLHICRLIGNDAVHPREISLSDSPEIVLPLFRFLNILVQRTISAEKERSNFIAGLPSNIQQKITAHKEAGAADWDK
ncbi:hypothetical protein DPQ22_04145 [Candidatus Tokpelaia sp.]|nr:hypothetical protein DPQ22_04145 [Candidatus Tokpelaia sp.]